MCHSGSHWHKGYSPVGSEEGDDFSVVNQQIQGLAMIERSFEAFCPAVGVGWVARRQPVQVRAADLMAPPRLGHDWVGPGQPGVSTSMGVAVEVAFASLFFRRVVGKVVPDFLSKGGVNFGDKVVAVAAAQLWVQDIGGKFVADFLSKGEVNVGDKAVAAASQLRVQDIGGKLVAGFLSMGVKGEVNGGDKEKAAVAVAVG